MLLGDINEYLFARMGEIAGTPTVIELARRLCERPRPYTGPSSAGLLAS